MVLKEKLANSLKDAIRAKDDVRKRTIRLALAAIKNTEIDRNAELEDNDILNILQKEVKSRRETIEAAEKADRNDMILEALAEIEALESFLPKQLSIEELQELAQEAIKEAGAVSQRDMGKVMQLLLPKVKGQADGKTVSQIVVKLLSS
jgi:uncharacterized protein YqeY